MAHSILSESLYIICPVLPSSHVFPVNPGGHWHRNSRPYSAWQIPWFLHGEGSQGLAPGIFSTFNKKRLNDANMYVHRIWCFKIWLKWKSSARGEGENTKNWQFFHAYHLFNHQMRHFFLVSTQKLFFQSSALLTQSSSGKKFWQSEQYKICCVTKRHISRVL